MRLRIAVIAVTLALFAQAAHAALFDDDEARRRIESTNQRVDALQRQVDSRLAAIEQQVKGQGLADLANQLQLLQSDIAKLRGQIEVVTYELEQAQKRQRDLYVDLDTRLRKLESAPAPAPAEGPGGGPGAAIVLPPTGAAPGAPSFGPPGSPPAGAGAL